MLKKDVLEYLGHEEGCRTGAITKLAIMLNVSIPTVSQWGDVIPEEKAKDIDKLLRNKRNLKKYNLKLKGRPVFCRQDYIERRLNFKRLRDLRQLKKLKAKYEGK